MRAAEHLKRPASPARSGRSIGRVTASLFAVLMVGTGLPCSAQALAQDQAQDQTQTQTQTQTLADPPSSIAVASGIAAEGGQPVHPLEGAATAALAQDVDGAASNATPPTDATARPASKRPTAARRAPPTDPWEGFNRGVFLFNGVLDHFLIEPLAQAYEFAMPSLLRSGLDNFLGNIGDAWSVINLVLQGKGAAAADMTARVGLNTIFGLGGLFDVAREAGIDRQSEDFGQTLAVWGAPTGPYLVLPIFGPSTVRDAAGFPVDRGFRQQFAPSGESQRWRWLGAQTVHARAEVLPFTRMLDTVALDKYVYVRDAYLARRRSLIHDGNPPQADDEEDEPTRASPGSNSRPTSR